MTKIKRVLWTMVLAAAAGSPCHTVWAQSTLPELETQLAQVSTDLGQPLSASGRMLALSRQEEVLKRLIALAPSDDRVPTWLTERALCVFEQIAADGSDLTVLVGLPGPGQIERVRELARNALDLADRAEIAAKTAAARLEAQLVDRSQPSDQAKARAAQIEQRLTVLVDLEQRQRIPYVRALARILLAATGGARDQAQAAARELLALNATTPRLITQRKLGIGFGLIHAAALVPDRAEDVLKTAAFQLTPVAERYTAMGGDVGMSLDQIDALRARLGLLRAGRSVSLRPRGPEAALEAELDLLEAEAQAAALLDRGSRVPHQRADLVTQAIKLLLPLLPPASSTAADVPGTLERQARVYEKIAMVTPASVPLLQLPPEAGFAIAVTKLRMAGKDDRTARNDAQTLLQQVAQRIDASPALRASARWERAVVVAQLGDALAELDAVSEVVVQSAESPMAVKAATRVVDLFAQQQAGTALGAPASQGTAIASTLSNLPESWRTRLGLLRSALSLLLSKDGKRGDQRWQQESAKFAVYELSSSTTLEALERALDLHEMLGALKPDSSEARAIAEALWRVVDRRRAEAALLAERVSGSGSLGKSAFDALVPWATRALAWSRRHDPEREPAYALVLGEALVGTGDAQAVNVLSELQNGPVDHPDSPLWSRLRFALAGAYRLSGEPSRAFLTLRQITDRLEGAPGTTARDPAYWAAWAEMLTVLQSQNTDGARSADIRGQIKRLELLDDQFGSGPASDRIRALRTLVGPAPAAGD